MPTLSHPKETFKFDTPEFPLRPSTDPKGYRPSPELVAATKVAITLGQPLLVTGEPGTGKTQLARYVADCLQLGEPRVFEAQTTSLKQDLYYLYDALSHFQWAQVKREQEAALSKEEFENKFITYQALGDAIRKGERCVVLIDEIDKAPRDLPNDLLAALDEMKFAVNQAPGTLEYKWPEKEPRPIVIITSNSEKNLPDAFLRRVVYHHIPFPKELELLDILKARTTAFADTDLQPLATFFLRLRTEFSLFKKPATAELIGWANLLHYLKFPVQKLDNLASLDAKERALLRSANAALAKTREDLDALNKIIGE